MKLESLVIALKKGAVNMFPDFVHTARHVAGVDLGWRLVVGVLFKLFKIFKITLIFETKISD